jgi:hypothetical protein
MALTSIVNLVESITNQLVGQGNDSQQGAQGAATANTSVSATRNEDSFTPSNEINSPQAAAQEAGLFQVSQLALIAAAASSIASQATQPPANPAPPPAEVAATNTSPVQPVTTPSVNALTIAAPRASAPTAVQVEPVTNTQGQIQAFNRALTTLGLSNNDIQKLDQIATLVNVFSPTAFHDLIRQFQELAQQLEQLAAAKAPAVSNANSAAYQVQQLSIQFSGFEPPANPAATQSSSTSGGTQTAPLHLEQVQFTLTSGAGHTANLLVPQQKAAAAPI